MRVAGDVHEQVAEEAVHEPWRTRRSCGRDEAHRDLELVYGIRTGLVHTWGLTRRPDEDAGEQIGERGVIQPVADEALEQVWPAEERAVAGRRAAEYQMVASAGAGVAAVEHELLGTEPALLGLV